MCVYLYSHTHKEYTSHSERVSVRMSGSRQKEFRQNPNKNTGIHAQESSTARLDTYLSIQTKVNVSNTCIPFCLRSVHASCRILNTCELLKVSFCWNCFCISFCLKSAYTRARCFMLFLNTSHPTALLPLVFHQPYFWKVFFKNEALS